MKKQLVAREQEITAVQARMQASYREHVKEVQQLQGKVGSGSGVRSGAPGGTWLPTGWGSWLQNRVGFGVRGRFTWPAHHACVNVSSQEDIK